MLISVVTVCLNAEDCIERTINSVFFQKDIKIQYIIKDGNSKDKTKSIIYNAVQQKQNENIELLYKKQSDTGIYSAMNQAIDVCMGEWIIFLNAGDEFADEYVLKRVLPLLLKKQADVIYGNAIVRDNDSDSIWYGDMSLIYKKMPFCHQTCFIRKELIKSYKFDETFYIASDYDMILNLFNRKAFFINSNEIIAVYYLDGISSIQYRNRLLDGNAVRSKYKIKMSWFEFCLKYVEAYLKEIIDAKFPEKLKTKLRAFYKKFIKKYGRI